MEITYNDKLSFSCYHAKLYILDSVDLTSLTFTFLILTYFRLGKVRVEVLLYNRALQGYIPPCSGLIKKICGVRGRFGYIDQVSHLFLSSNEITTSNDLLWSKLWYISAIKEKLNFRTSIISSNVWSLGYFDYKRQLLCGCPDPRCQLKKSWNHQVMMNTESRSAFDNFRWFNFLYNGHQ